MCFQGNPSTRGSQSLTAFSFIVSSISPPLFLPPWLRTESSALIKSSANLHEEIDHFWCNLTLQPSSGRVLLCVLMVLHVCHSPKLDVSVLHSHSTRQHAPTVICTLFTPHATTRKRTDRFTKLQFLITLSHLTPSYFDPLRYLQFSVTCCCTVAKLFHSVEI